MNVLDLVVPNTPNYGDIPTMSETSFVINAAARDKNRTGF
jgi:hypothetical protein